MPITDNVNFPHFPKASSVYAPQDGYGHNVDSRDYESRTLGRVWGKRARRIASEEMQARRRLVIQRCNGHRTRERSGSVELRSRYAAWGYKKCTTVVAVFNEALASRARTPRRQNRRSLAKWLRASHGPNTACALCSPWLALRAHHGFS